MLILADMMESAYLAGRNRPVHEVLFSRDQDMSSAFHHEFVGMTRNPIALAELEEVRRELKKRAVALLRSIYYSILSRASIGCNRIRA